MNFPSGENLSCLKPTTYVLEPKVEKKALNVLPVNKLQKLSYFYSPYVKNLLYICKDLPLFLISKPCCSSAVVFGMVGSFSPLVRTTM